MRSYANNYDEPQENSGPPETAESHLTSYLFSWMRKASVKRLPEPMPAMATDAANWWLSTMCEKPPMMLEGDDKENARLHSAHVASCRSSLRGFLSMTTQQRSAVVSMCTDGHVNIKYRGDTFAQFVYIANEADIYADNPEQYSKHILMRAKHVMGMMQWDPDQKTTTNKA